jgi:hypothetical protein
MTNHLTTIAQDLATITRNADAFDIEAARLAPYKAKLATAQAKANKALKALIKAQDALLFADIDVANAMEEYRNA